MWWHKPLDIAEPTLIGGDKVRPLLAYMWMSSAVSVQGVKAWDVHGRVRDEFDAIWPFRYPRLEDLLFGEQKTANIPLNGSEESSDTAVDEDGGVGQRHPTTPNGTNTEEYGPPLPTSDSPSTHEMLSRHYKSGSHPNIRSLILTYLHSHPSLHHLLHLPLPPGLSVRKTLISSLSPLTLTRWSLCHHAITTYALEPSLRHRHYTHSSDSYLATRISNSVSLIGTRPYEIWFGFAIAGLLYGGLHMLAWNAPFGSRVEMVFWRVAAASVTGAPVVMVPLAMLFDKRALGQGGAELMQLVQGRKGGRGEGGVLYWGRMGAVVVCAPVLFAGPVLCLSYVVGRVYLVVECFKNVAHLPKAVFQDVSWPAYLPHIS